MLSYQLSARSGPCQTLGEHPSGRPGFMFIDVLTSSDRTQWLLWVQNWGSGWRDKRLFPTIDDDMTRYSENRRKGSSLSYLTETDAVRSQKRAETPFSLKKVCRDPGDLRHPPLPPSRLVLHISSEALKVSARSVSILMCLLLSAGVSFITLTPPPSPL